jgi:hypothetical protein
MGGLRGNVRWAVAGALLVAACGGPPPPGPPGVTPAAAPSSPALGTPPAETAAAPAGAVPAPPAITPPAAEPPVAVPAGALYACVIAADGARQVSAIELAPQVRALCARNPEMGPCQYARAACRRSGGRVFAADGQEITVATEAAYDKRVLRARLQSN